MASFKTGVCWMMKNAALSRQTSPRKIITHDATPARE